jgi:hypothetical protein
MKFKSESGQAVIVLVLISVLVFGVVYLGLLANRPGIERGAETIGDAAGEVIDDALYEQQMQNMAAWKNQQTVAPNAHSVKNHGADAWATTDCYNRNGAFHVMSTRDDGIHLLCMEDDGTVRDMILKQRGNSNEFDFDNAFTPKDGILKRVIEWINRKPGAGKFTMPDNAVIYIDGVAAP